MRKRAPGSTSAPSEVDGELWSLHESLSREVPLPADAFVIGEPIVVTGLDYDGAWRRGLTARCRRENGTQYVVCLADVHVAPGTAAARGVAAYREWLGLGRASGESGAEPPRRRSHAATEEDIDVSRAVDLVVLSVKERAARCRLLESQRSVTFRTGDVWDMVPGEIVTVRPRKLWRYARHAYLSGEIANRRVDVAALGLEPLRLEDLGPWDPNDEYWGEDDRTREPWTKAVIARGVRNALEMEQVLPGVDPSDPELDPILEAIETGEAADFTGARAILMKLVEAELRCLDAHAHLGNQVFDSDAAHALRHYEIGVRLGEMSLGPGFDGVLGWGFIDKRPFLRCLQGYGLCLWRLLRRDEAADVFERMLWMNPGDNQGIRFLLPEVQAGHPWQA